MPVMKDMMGYRCMGAWLPGAWVHGCQDNTFQQLMKQWDRMKVCIYVHRYVCKYLLTLSIIDSILPILTSGRAGLLCEDTLSVIIAIIYSIGE